MFTVYAIHAPEPDKLKLVKAEMIHLGAPKIEVVDCGDHYMALEGSHRLAAAQALGIEPALIIHTQEDLIDVRKYDWFEPQNWAWFGSAEGDVLPLYSAGEVAGEIYNPVYAEPYRFPAEKLDV